MQSAMPKRDGAVSSVPRRKTIHLAVGLEIRFAGLANHE
ncbi:MAG: hypothetical protein JWR69_2553 [Pedosphaera sp.]|nr:hypothetical protein [Pedosphaera sp.]